MSQQHSLGQWIGGEPVVGSGSTTELMDPARNQTIATASAATRTGVDDAVGMARAVFESGTWSNREPRARGDSLLAVAQLLRENREELALLESRNVGKPILQAFADVARAAEFFDYFGRMVVDLPGEVVQNEPSQVTLVIREPLGVVASIVPWNFPLMIASASIASALAAGNTVVLKPSPLTPLTALRLAELTKDVLPPGVLNVVTGGAGVGEALVSHRDVRRIFFTGSSSVGAKIMAAAAPMMKRVTLELGGKSPTIVLEDAPIEPSVKYVLQRLTLNQGQNCAAGSRLLVHESIFHRFIEDLVRGASKLSAGDPQSETTDLGPLISEEQRARVNAYVEKAAAEDEPLYVGELNLSPPFSSGFFAPISMWRSKPGSTLWREEVFGPVLAVETFEDDDEAVSLANDSDYGLLATVWSGDRGRALRIARSLEVGVARINNAGLPVNAPWGGFKMSGVGRTYGRYGFEAETELKQISIDLE